MITAAHDPRSGLDRRRLLPRVATALMSVVLVVGFVLFGLIAVGPHLFGYRTATMLTGSMAPAIEPGDVIVSTPAPATAVEVGDVISYQIPVEDRRVETNRVIQVLRNPDGTVAVRTKGDANDNVDPWTATLEGDEVWAVQAVIPELGTAIRTLRSPLIQHYAFGVALATMTLLGLSLIWVKAPEDDLPLDLDTRPGPGLDRRPSLAGAS